MTAVHGASVPAGPGDRPRVDLARACGTPVLATPRGAVAEIVRHGVTVHRDVGELAAAVPRLTRLGRDACREHVERTFGPEAFQMSWGRPLRSGRGIELQPLRPSASVARA